MLYFIAGLILGVGWGLVLARELAGLLADIEGHIEAVSFFVG